MSRGDYSVRNDVVRAGRTREALVHPKNILQMRGAWISLWEDDRQCGRSSSLRGFSTAGGSGRLFPARDVCGMERSRRSLAPVSTTKDTYVQGIYGSDGTRTRDLRRDRPVLV